MFAGRRSLLVVTLAGIVIAAVLFGVLGVNANENAPVLDGSFDQVAISEEDISNVLVERPMRTSKEPQPLREMDHRAPLVINGESVSFSCLEEESDGSICISGFPLETVQWITKNGGKNALVVVGANERVGGIPVTHGFPLVVDEATRLLKNGAPIAYDEFESNVLYDFFYYSVKGTFMVQEGWLQAVELNFVECPTPDLLDLVFDCTDLEPLAESNQRDADSFCIDEGEETILSGEVAALVEHAGETPYLSFQIDDNLGGARVGHAVRIDMPKGIPEGFNEEMASKMGRAKIVVELKEGALEFVDIV